MPEDDDDAPSAVVPRTPDYRVARIVAAGTLVFVVAFIVVFDAISQDYEASPVIVTALLGCAATLLGIEGLAFLRGSK